MSPNELVLSARAGAPLSEIEALLDQHGQQLAFEPMDYGLLFGAETGGATIGGVDRGERLRAAADQGRRGARSSARVPLRHRSRRAGEIRRPRDEERHRLRPVEARLRLLRHAGAPHRADAEGAPEAETECTLLAIGADEAESLALLRRATATPCEPSALAMLPAGAALALDADAAAIRLEGPAISVTARRDDLVARLASGGAPI